MTSDSLPQEAQREVFVAIGIRETNRRWHIIRPDDSLACGAFAPPSNSSAFRYDLPLDEVLDTRMPLCGRCRRVMACRFPCSREVAA